MKFIHLFPNAILTPIIPTHFDVRRCSVFWSGVQVTVDVLIGNGEPEAGEQERLSTGMPATVGRSQLIVTGNASTDCRSIEGGQD